MKMIRAALVAAALAGVSAPAWGQQYNQSQMWGTGSGGFGVPGALESATAHLTDGLIVGQSKAANDLAPNTTNNSTTVYNQSIGSQNVQDITGNNNNVTGTQDASNTGKVTNTGQNDINGNQSSSIH